MAAFAYLSALQSWILFKIDSIALFRASRFLAVPWCGVKYSVITSESGSKTPQSDIQRCEKFQTLRGPLGNISGKDND
jgi:hypothetical protein